MKGKCNFSKILVVGLFQGINKRINKSNFIKILSLFYDGGPYHIETSPLICTANQWTGLYMVGTSVMKELNVFTVPVFCNLA